VCGGVFRCVDRLIQRDEELAQLVSFIHDHGQSRHYAGHDVTHLLRLLADQTRPSVTSSGNPRKSRDDNVDVAGDTSPRKPGIDVFRRVARGLHYVSIAILSFLLFEVELVTRALQ